MNELVNYKGLLPVIERVELKKSIAEKKDSKNNASLRMHLKSLSHLKHMMQVMEEHDVEIELNNNYNVGVVTELILKALYLECITAFEGRYEQKLETYEDVYDVRSSISSYSLCSGVSTELPVLLYANSVVRVIQPEALKELYNLVINHNPHAKRLMKIEQSGEIKLKPAINLSHYAMTNSTTDELESLLSL